MADNNVRAIIKQETRDEAKSLYFKHWGTHEISEYLQVKYETLRQWIKRYDWKTERDALISSEIDNILKRRSNQINRVMTDGLESIAKTLNDVKSTNKVLTIDQAAKVANLLGNIDKLYRLQTGKPTEIKEERKLSMSKDISTKDDLMKVIEEDPFIDVEFKDVGPKSD